MPEASPKTPELSPKMPEISPEIPEASAETLWSRVQASLKAELPENTWQSLFAPLHYLKQTDQAVVLRTEDAFAAIWIQENFKDILARHFTNCAGRNLRVELIADPAVPASPRAAAELGCADAELNGAPRALRAQKILKVALNPRNTFENFVVGNSNELAHAASIAVAEAPGQSYNPLFLYGQTGLGKTHLMHAIAHKIFEMRPSASISYLSTEQFTNEYIEAIQRSEVTRFRKRYRQLDILLIDDIQFLNGKERIQEEFFHTFNELFERQGQIVISSDRPATEISKVEARLASRFQWGMVADIQAPDYETRVAIIQAKAQAMGLELSTEIAQFLAQSIASNIRRIEGALMRLSGYAALLKGSINLASAQKLLRDVLEEEARARVTVENIQQRVSEYHKLRLADMTSRRRPAHIVFPRQIAMYLSRLLTAESLQEIGEAFGRDHGTVIHACKTVENMMEQDESVRRKVEHLKGQMSFGQSNEGTNA